MKTDEREKDRQRVTGPSCEDERMLLTHGLSAEAIIIGDKRTRTNRSGSDSNTQQRYENTGHVIVKKKEKRVVTMCHRLMEKISWRVPYGRGLTRRAGSQNIVRMFEIYCCTHPD